MDKITIERETLERAIADYDSAAGNDGTLLSWNRARDNLLALLRAALAAQPAPAAVPLTDGDCIALMLHLGHGTDYDQHRQQFADAWVKARAALEATK